MSWQFIWRIIYSSVFAIQQVVYSPCIPLAVSRLKGCMHSVLASHQFSLRVQFSYPCLPAASPTAICSLACSTFLRYILIPLSHPVFSSSSPSHAPLSHDTPSSLVALARCTLARCTLARCTLPLRTLPAPPWLIVPWFTRFWLTAPRLSAPCAAVSSPAARPLGTLAC